MSDPRPIRLRPHHLACMLTYVGRGYSAAFTANMTSVLQRITHGALVELVLGPDDLCAPLLRDDPGAHCHSDSITARDAAALPPLAEALGAGWTPGAPPGAPRRITAETAAALRARYADGAFTTACAGCEWRPLCADVAAGGYDKAVLHPR